MTNIKSNKFPFYAACIINTDKNKKRKSLSKTHFTSITKIQKNKCYIKILYEAKKIFSNLKEKIINTPHCKLCNLTKTNVTDCFNSNFFSYASTCARTTYYRRVARTTHYQRAKKWNILHGPGKFYDNLFLFEDVRISGASRICNKDCQFIMGNNYFNWKKYIWSQRSRVITFECGGCNRDEYGTNLKLLLNYDYKNQISIKVVSHSSFNIDHFDKNVKKYMNDLYILGDQITYNKIGENLNIKKLKMMERDDNRDLYLQKRLPKLIYLSVDTIVNLSTNFYLEHLKIHIWNNIKLFNALPQIIKSTKKANVNFKSVSLTIDGNIYNEMIYRQSTHLTTIKCQKFKIYLGAWDELDWDGFKYKTKKFYIDYKCLPDVPKIVFKFKFPIELQPIKNENYYSTPKSITHVNGTCIINNIS